MSLCVVSASIYSSPFTVEPEPAQFCSSKEVSPLSWLPALSSSQSEKHITHIMYSQLVLKDLYIPEEFCLGATFCIQANICISDYSTEILTVWWRKRAWLTAAPAGAPMPSSCQGNIGRGVHRLSCSLEPTPPHTFTM